MASYGFSFRASLRRGVSPGRLYLRVVHKGVSRSLTTNYRIFPEEWDGVGRRLLFPYVFSERSRTLSDYQGSMLSDLQRLDVVIHELDRSGVDYTIDELMERFRSVLFGNSLGAWVDQLSGELEHAGYTRTARAYRTAASRLRRFNGGQDVKLEHITSGLIGDFQHHLKSEGKHMNTVSFYMRTLRSIYNKAVSEGRAPRRAESPFTGVYTGVSPTRKRALSSAELLQLSAFDPTQAGAKACDSSLLTDPLQHALAMFLFSYHARGMCFVDLAHLKKSDLCGNTIRYRRRKTGQSIELTVHPAMRRILNWFAPQTVGSDYLFPVITSSRKNLDRQYDSALRMQNQRLRKIASMLGFGKYFSTHAARHSWATMARNEGLSLAVISEGLGHASQKTTEIYLASLEQSVLDRASRLVSEAITRGRRPRERGKEFRPPVASWCGPRSGCSPNGLR